MKSWESSLKKSKEMKKIKILLVAVFAMAAISAGAQWGTNGTHIYNTNTGYVGIGNGTSFTPTENLHIKVPSGTANIAIESAYGSGDQVIGRYRIRNTTTGDMYYIGLRTWGGSREAIQSAFDGVNSRWLEFAYVNLDTRKYELRTGILDAEFLNQGNVLLNNTGSVGIGMGAVAIPAGSKLAVNGKIVCKEVEVTLTGWSDYVFKEDYNLLPLSEVEKHINENGFLPGMPSEKEVVENGISLGEMNKKLCEKVEELTLYVIQLQKEIDNLKSGLSANK